MTDMKRTIFIVAAALAVILSVTILIAWGIGRPLREFPAWLEAISTLAAFLAAAVAVQYAAGAFRLESQREQRWEDTQRSSQATQVAGWFGAIERNFRDAHGEPRHWYKEPGVFLRNASDVPVGLVSIQLRYGDEVLGHQHVKQLAPSDEPTFVKMDPDLLNKVQSATMQSAGPGSEEHPTVAIQFTDSAGVRWTRSHEGQLIER